MGSERDKKCANLIGLGKQRGLNFEGTGENEEEGGCHWPVNVFN